MATEIVRRYNVSDAEMLSEARNFASQLLKYLNAFTTLDGKRFTSDTIINFSALIAAAEELPTDNVLIDIQANSTRMVTEALEECYEEINFTKYYVKKIFKNNSPVMNQFGYNDLNNVRKSSDRMIRFMEDFIGVIVGYESTLLDAGFPESKKEELISLKERLKSLRDGQKTIKKERPIKTAERVVALNKVWEEMAKVHDAANIIYRDDREMRNVFRLPMHAPSNKSSMEDTEPEASVVNNSTED